MKRNDPVKGFLPILALALLSQGTAAGAGELKTYPETIERSCRGGSAKIFDECGDQLALFETARREANRQGKVLLVSYGAEWCIWCHVFHAYATGDVGTFTHTYSSPEDIQRDTVTMFETPEPAMQAEAEALAGFVAENFVLLHLDNRYAPGADAAVASTGFDPSDIVWLPFLFTVDANGTFAAMLDHDAVEVRREGFFWYRGYDRGNLQAELERMRKAATK